MAEISYPFAADSAGGGSNIVSQVDWQSMSHLWSEDRIDFQLASSSYADADLPFGADLSGSNLVVQPGSAWVGGFYYKLDAAWSIAAPTNTGSQPRHDLLVIRADMSAGSVNLAVKTGQPAASPVDPTVQKSIGGIWEMPLYSIRLEANSGAVTFMSLRRFDGPTTVFTPWNRKEASQSLPLGTYTIDMDSNLTGGMEEGFRGTDGDMITRTLGNRPSYTPDLFPVSNLPASSSRKGYWRRIAPGTVSVSIEITTGSKAATVSSGVFTIGVSLPVAANGATHQLFRGYVSNPRKSNSKPNAFEVIGRTADGDTTSCYLFTPSTGTTHEGLDSLGIIPAYSVLTLTGVYETATL